MEYQKFLFILVCLISANLTKKVTYSFTEFPYKESTKNELTYQEAEGVCKSGCAEQKGTSFILCVRKCISPTCFKEVYEKDLIEEGEIDVRFNSFKGCFIQRHNRF